MNELTLEAKRENLDSVLDFVHQALDESQCSPKSLMQLDLAVEELFVNIAQYAYYPKTGAVTILSEILKALPSRSLTRSATLLKIS